MSKPVCLYHCPTCDFEFWAPGDSLYKAHLFQPESSYGLDDAWKPPVKHDMELVAYALPHLWGLQGNSPEGILIDEY